MPKELVVPAILYWIVAAFLYSNLTKLLPEIVASFILIQGNGKGWTAKEGLVPGSVKWKVCYYDPNSMSADFVSIISNACLIIM